MVAKAILRYAVMGRLFFQLSAWCFVGAIIGCNPAGESDVPPRPNGRTTENTVPALTALDAKSALITLATENPGAFSDFPPDPKKLAPLDVKNDSEGRFRFGAFLIDPSRLRYSAEIEWTGGVHNYRGDFVFRGGQWNADPPEILRFHYPR